MEELRAKLLTDPRVQGDALAERLVPVLLSRAELSSGGFPFLPEAAYAQFRDTVPHILGMAPRVLAALEALEALLDGFASPDQREMAGRAAKVIRTMLNTAAITSPPDLWVIRHLLGALKTLGLTDRLLAGEILRPETCTAGLAGETPFQVESGELAADLRFLQTRGYVQRIEGGYVAATGSRPRDVLRDIKPISDAIPAGVTGVWARLLS
ncbi:MAG: hypothetical protein VYE15_01280, partial [Myxococcota bacterium]|nr:hypothetical protein [Myxococcota bacterium]